MLQHMHRRSFLIALAGFVVILMAGTFSYGQGKKKGSDNMPAEILELVNKHRAGRHLKPLQMNALITHEAEVHSHNMATGKVEFGHDGYDERMDRLTRKIKKSTGSAENVAYGPHTAEAVVQSWLESPGHRKNIEGDYNLTGIGIAKNASGRPYYTQIFIKN